MLQDNLIGAALRFRDTELWKLLSDSQLFAVKLSNGEMVYCSVMGESEEYYSVGMYKGAEALSSFFNTLRMSEMSEIDMLSAKMLFNHINCTFENASTLDFPEYKAEVQAYAKANGLKLRRSHGYPDFVCFRPFRMEGPISAPEEQAWVTETLEAATALALRVKKEGVKAFGFSESGNYPSEHGGENVPMVERQADGSFLVSQVALPAFSALSYPVVPFDNEFSTRKFKGIEKHPYFTLQCKALPFPVAELVEEQRLGILLIFASENEDDILFPPFFGKRFPDSSSDLLTEFGEYMIEVAGCFPGCIEVCDELTAGIMKDFCQKCGIKLRVLADKKMMESIWKQICMYMMGTDFDPSL